MYHILNKAIEDLPAVRIGADSGGEYDIVFVPIADLGPPRFESPAAAVFLTQSKVSWLGTPAFEVRWTSLAS